MSTAATVPFSVVQYIGMMKAYAEAFGEAPGAIEMMVEQMLPFHVDGITDENIDAVAAYREVQSPTSDSEHETETQN